MSRPARPPRLIPQQLARKKKTFFLRRGQTRNAFKRRRGHLRVWLPILWFILGVTILAEFCFGLMFLYYQFLTCPTFCITDINNIEVIGIQRFTRAQILEMAHLDSQTSLLALKPTVVEQTLLAHPLIATAELERHWPNRITLRLTERQPVALVQLEELYYTDLNGSLFKPSSTADPHDFPVITGLTQEDFPDGSRPASGLVTKVLKLLSLLQEAPQPLTSSRIAEIHVDSECGFTLYLTGLKTALFLGFNNLPEKIQKLHKVWPFLAQRGYLARTGRINLGHPQHLVLSLKGMEETNPVRQKEN
ncbi:MAG: FtsQ-type POTRA domain-containing protein [Syntrophobacterales bacterium]|jgi:cell division protein FtsQ